MIVVLDASALIAYLQGEPGGDLVNDILLNSADMCVAHAINLCEVYYGTRRDHGEQVAQQVLSILRMAGIATEVVMDENLWLSAGRIKADYKRVSLADCFCAALANRIGGEVLTSDRHEFEALAVAGVCKVRFIR
ncbi:MAG: PIN domain-containing protein [Armatimonadota bacterium]